MNCCIGCGIDYQYDSNNPLGASSSYCASCRKKDTKLSKLIRLFEIAGDHCIKCGYNGSVHALCLVNAVEPFGVIKTQEQLEAQASKQFVLCLNCKSEIDHKVYEMKVISSKPIKVEFYFRAVQVVLTPMKSYEQKEPDVEIVNDIPEDTRKV